MPAIHSPTSLAYCLVVKPLSTPHRPAYKNWPERLLSIRRCSSIALRVCSVNSNRTGRPVYFCRTVARSGV